MADITMCQDHECPSRENCFRYTAQPSQIQAYANFERQGDKCRSFWDNAAYRPFPRDRK